MERGNGDHARCHSLPRETASQLERPNAGGRAAPRDAGISRHGKGHGLGQSPRPQGSPGIRRVFGVCKNSPEMQSTEGTGVASFPSGKDHGAGWPRWGAETPRPGMGRWTARGHPPPPPPPPPPPLLSPSPEQKSSPATSPLPAALPRDGPASLPGFCLFPVCLNSLYRPPRCRCPEPCLEFPAPPINFLSSFHSSSFNSAAPSQRRHPASLSHRQTPLSLRRAPPPAALPLKPSSSPPVNPLLFGDRAAPGKVPRFSRHRRSRAGRSLSEPGLPVPSAPCRPRPFPPSRRSAAASSCRARRLSGDNRMCAPRPRRQPCHERWHARVLVTRAFPSPRARLGKY